MTTLGLGHAPKVGLLELANPIREVAVLPQKRRWEIWRDLFFYDRDLDERFHRLVARHVVANRLNPEVEITGSNRKYPTVRQCVGVEIKNGSCHIFCK